MPPAQASPISHRMHPALIDHAGLDLHPSLSPQGDAVAFASDRGGALAGEAFAVLGGKVLQRRGHEQPLTRAENQVPGGADFFHKFRQLVITGYFTSEIGHTQARRHVPVPGKYEGCIPYKKGDKAWAT